MLREVEGMSTAETAACLGLGEDAVKVRLHRARARLRKFLSDRLRTQTTQTFPFGGARCDRVVSRVFERIRTLGVLRKSSSNATSCRSPHVECPHEVPMR
jgi:RNA polymerase sigma-70 factor (ECF subfamily)